MTKLKVENVSKSYGAKRVLANVSFSLGEGEIVCILGLSGCGKTTLFNVISGLEKADSGAVLLGGQSVGGEAGRISYMMQKDLLFPFYTVLDNVVLPLLVKGVPKKRAREAALPLFAEFGLAGCERLYPRELSGGMRQRAALLRTYLFSKDVALLDEPFSALDALTKAEIHQWFLQLMREIKLSTLFITHDIDEALLLADRILIMQNVQNTAAAEDVQPAASTEETESGTDSIATAGANASRCASSADLEQASAEARAAACANASRCASSTGFEQPSAEARTESGTSLTENDADLRAGAGAQTTDNAAISSIKCELKIDLPRPRNRDVMYTSEFLRLKREITELL